MTNPEQTTLLAGEAETLSAEKAVATGAITDGSQVLAHDGYDVETFEQAVGEYTRLARTLEETGQTVCTGPALLRDLFWSFHKRAPRVAPVAPLSPAHEINQQIVEQVLATREWNELHASGTINDPLNSALATIGVSQRTIAALGAETIKALNQLSALTGEVEQLFAQAEVLKELAALAPDIRRAETLATQAEQAITEAQQKEQQAQRLRQQLDAAGETREQQVRQGARQGLAEALQEIEQFNAAISAFGGDGANGWGSGDGTGRRDLHSVKSKLAIAQRVSKSAKLQQIAAVAGRFKRIALQQQRTKVEHPPDEITSITIGNQLERVLPSELALLADAKLEDLFYLKFAEANLAQYDLIGHEPEGQGPILLAVDESESMSWLCGPMTKEVWSKAVLLGLLSIARLQKRDFAVLHFSGQSNLKVEVFPQGQASPKQVIACASHFFNGGTVFDAWMKRALELVGEAKFDKADAICISDGVGGLTAETLANWQKMRAVRGMRSYSILIGTSAGEQLLWQISDAVFRLDDLQQDLSALETIFSI